MDIKAFADEYLKIASPLTEQARAHLSKKDFAVPPGKSNTGKEAYPIPDEKHARSALGFAKMHGDKADLARVEAKVEKKFPGLEKNSYAAGAIGRMVGPSTRMGKHLLEHEHAYDLGGLGMLALPSAHNIAHQVSNARQGKEVDKKELAHSGIELAGLGTLGAPVLAQALKGGH